MRKTRSQTQAENAQSSAAIVNSSAGQQNPARPQGIPMESTYPPIGFDEVRSMVMFFRVFELQRLLTTLNSNHVGRKNELQKRVIDLLSVNFAEVAPKVRELYKACATDGNNSPEYGPPDPKRMFPPQMVHPIQDVRTNLVNTNIVVPFPNVAMQPGYPIHPDVKLKKLAFYDNIYTLLQPSTLVPTTHQRTQEASFYFTLTPQQATEIASNRDIRNNNKIEHVIQVQLRFCLLETSCEQEDCFPPNIMVKVNNKVCQLPTIIPTNRPNVDPKRPPRPVNVTPNVKLSPTVPNTITVQWSTDFTRGYCISAYLVKKLTSSQLLTRMKNKGAKPADFTRSLIKEKLQEDVDCEIATTMLKVSLLCPLGKMKMSIPCRASTCSHLQCFDASLYLQMNERKPTWNCPVCDKPATFDNLVIDGYFQEVLTSLNSDNTEIQLHKDGSWSTQLTKPETQILDTSFKTIQKVEVISDDLEVITTEPEQKVPIKAGLDSASSATTAAVTVNEPTSTTNNETVDLTLSDSDDDLPLKRRVANSKPNTNSNGLKNPPILTKLKQNENLSSSIISLDSPSPPSSPNPATENGGSNSGVTSTTAIPYCQLPSNPLESTTPPNYQINPVALNRLDNQSINAAAASLAMQRLSGNWNIVRPYRESEDQENKI